MNNFERWLEDQINANDKKYPGFRKRIERMVKEMEKEIEEWEAENKKD